jgi:hypothetical protein
MTAATPTVTFAEWIRLGPLAFFGFDLNSILGGTMQASIAISLALPAKDSSLRAAWGYIFPPSGATGLAAAADVRGSNVSVGPSGAGLAAGLNYFRIGGVYRCA